ncbi:TonB-dependent receptor plug domain-containing protein [Aeoliella mucimassa]|uniref:Colicin I receptor n=1 Tax=Aeoliella mucimassa TaxID=2527972 RepID=A0A518AHC2_9BACT|nr:TonB-dependent receptor [Aeoliella mucimassa]QDU54109.1 Colicin I receptor precursor [Aeoliella mucimassa]
MLVRRPRWCGILGCSLLLLAMPAWGQAPGPMPPSSTADVAESEESADDESTAEGDLDNLLDMDLADLGNVQVKESVATFSDPVVEGVSRTSEKSSTAPGVVQVITAEQIRAYGGKTLREVLERATSVWTPNSIYAPNNVTSIRGDLFGHYDTHVLILLNNRPFKDTAQGGMSMAIYNSFPIEMLDRIEIIRGPGSVLYGTNAYAGVINLVTKSSETAKTGGNALAGSDDTQRYGLTVASGEKDHSLYVGAMTLNDGGYDFAGVDEALQPFSKKFGQNNVGVISSLRHGNWSFDTFYGQTEQGGVGLPTGEALPYGFYTAVRAFADVGYRLGDDELSLETHFTYNYSDQSSLGTPSVLFHFKSHDYLVEPILRAQLTERLNWMAGGTFEVRQGTIFEDYSKTWYSAYTQLTYDATDWLTLTGGVQGNMPGTLPGGVAPRAGAIVTLTDLWTAKLLYGHAFRSPSAIETDFDSPPVLAGNPNLAPETIDTYEIQFVRSNEHSRLAGTYFLSQYESIIARDTSGIPITYENTGGLEVQGVELESSVKASSCWQLVGSVTWQQNISDEGVANTTLVPNWMAKVGVAYDNGLVGFGLFDSYFSAPASVTIINPAADIVNPIPTEYHSMSLNTRVDLGRLCGYRSDVVEWQFLMALLTNSTRTVEARVG